MMMYSRSFAVSTILSLVLVLGCGSNEKKDRDFFTSGDREADQRAEQRIAKVQQMRGEEDAATKDVKPTLFERLGGEQGINAIVDDFVNRALADPRVNWQRQGLKRGGFWRRNRSLEWDASQANVQRVKKHIAQFFALSTGGPTTYEGRDMRQVHEGLRITNAQFDAAVGDLKATLDKLAVATDDQKELLAIVETTRTQVVSER